jgi:hypothetical protein
MKKLIVTLLLLVGQASFAQTDDEAAQLLRDLRRTGDVQVVPNNKIYLESHPGFMALIRELSAVSPAFGMRVWQNLIETQIWLASGSLPLLPAAATGVTRQNAQVQVAIRLGQRIIISTRASDQLRSPFEYVLLHEALHGIVNTQSAMDHERVRAFVRFVYENRGSIGRENLLSIGRSLLVPTETFAYRSVLGSPVPYEDFQHRLIADGGQSEDLCFAYGQVMSPEYVYGARAGGTTVVPSSWGQFERCRGKDAVAELLRRHPELNKTSPQGLFAVHTSMYLNPISQRSPPADVLNQCKALATGGLKERITARIEQLRGLQAAAANLRSRFADLRDEEAVFTLIALQALTSDPSKTLELYANSWSDFPRNIVELTSKLQTLENNLSACAQRFGANFVNRSRP